MVWWPPPPQTFHDDLNIDRSQTAGGNIHAVPHLHSHKAGLHILDGQQVVGSLRNGNTGLGGTSPLTEMAQLRYIWAASTRSALALYSTMVTSKSWRTRSVSAP